MSNSVIAVFWSAKYQSSKRIFQTVSQEDLTILQWKNIQKVRLLYDGITRSHSSLYSWWNWGIIIFQIWSKQHFPSFFSSQSNGNCLYSSISIHLVGNSSLALKLRVISCLELFLNAEFYFNHPNFKYFHTVHREKFKHFNNALSFAFKTQPPTMCNIQKNLFFLRQFICAKILSLPLTLAY